MYSHILDCSAKGVRYDALLNVLLTQSEVGKLYVTLGIQQDILRLQVPIDNS